eukprot:GFKZ01003511.1.p1 GENE.GFKZ01003511.1~~GFKZ01003511.1.p1  ORF type:complete len:104 (-),score=3.09 GFKZ01003511.1:151-462(-)
MGCIGILCVSSGAKKPYEQYGETVRVVPGHAVKDIGSRQQATHGIVDGWQEPYLCRLVFTFGGGHRSHLRVQQRGQTELMARSGGINVVADAAQARPEHRFWL